MPYIDNLVDLLKLVNSIPLAETAKIAIFRPTTHFEIVTADNPDMIRSLALQNDYVHSKLTQITDTLTPQQLAIRKKELIHEYQKPLSKKACQEQQGLLKAMRAQGIPTLSIMEDKGWLETGDFDYYTDQIFATDTGQYCTIQACGFIKTHIEPMGESAVKLFQQLNGRTGIILFENKLYHANQKNKSIMLIDTATMRPDQLTILQGSFSTEDRECVMIVENSIINLVTSITGQPIEDTLLYIQASFTNQQRKGEDRLAAAQATNIGAETLNLLDEHGEALTFEGGDIRQMPGKKLFFVGQGHRTQAQASQAIADATGYVVLPIHLQQAQFYHVDCCFLPLPNDAAVIYEGEYSQDEAGNNIINEKGWPVIIDGTETMAAIDRVLIRTIYNSNKLILITKAEALAFATNAAVLQSTTDNRFKLFTNGNRSELIVDEIEAINNHTISFTNQHIQEMLSVTGGMMDIIEVPYSTMHGSGGSVRCTVQEVACTVAALKPDKVNPYHFSDTIDKLEARLSVALILRHGLFATQAVAVRVTRAAIVNESGEPNASTP